MPARRSRPALTRRRFLGHLGAVGGSSLVMTAMASWDQLAGAAGQRPALEGRPRAAKVIVIGAGISGLVVGYELGKLGYDFRILEARDRVGGLAWTIRRGMHARQTAGRIHSDLERGFIRAEVIPYAVFMQYGSEHAVKEAGKLQIEGKDYIVADGDILHIRFNV